MRIISGSLKGRKLISPKDDRIRPSSDRTRESLFNILMHGELGGACVIDQNILDLCCGTGAMGLEALSRGATHCSFVDSHKQSLALAEDNAEVFGVEGHCQFFERDLPRLPAFKHNFTLVIMDAPYGSGLITRTLKALTEQRVLESHAVIALEYADETFTFDETLFETITERKYGKANVTILRYIG